MAKLMPLQKLHAQCTYALMNRWQRCRQAHGCPTLIRFTQTSSFNQKQALNKLDTT